MRIQREMVREVKEERNIERMNKRRGERREKRERMNKRRGERREEIRRMEMREGRRDKRGRMEELRSVEREKRQRIEPRQGRMEDLRGERREERQKIESRGHMRDKRERPDEQRDHRREKRPRSDNEREDRERRRAEFDFVKRRGERIETRVERTVKRERSRERHGLTPRERPRSISDLNRIYGRLPIDREGDQRKRFSRVFESLENVNSKRVNILEGLELHTNVFDSFEQTRITDFVHGMQRLGQENRLKEHTYTAPTKWMRGKGRVTLQFGCCYNYAKDKDGNLPGIMRNVQVDPIPPLLKDMIQRLVSWQILPKTCVPDSCIINIYDEGDCIPPHIDHKDFLRPFCTVSFLSDAKILFGRNLKVIGPGAFSGSTAISLPCGSVLVLSGNGADEAKHCVPAVRSKRISITFRKMDHRKLPYQHRPDPDLNFA